MATQDSLFMGPNNLAITYRQMDPYDSNNQNIFDSSLDPHDILTGIAKRNVLREVITRCVNSPVISQHDVTRTLKYLMDCRFITYKDMKMVQSPFGLNVTHNLTMEDPSALKEFEFRYLINKTSPARQVSVNNTPPEVTMEVVVKKVNLENPIVVSFSVKQDLYKNMKQALEQISGLGLPDNLKVYIGQQGNIPQTLLWKTTLINYMQKINQNVEGAATSICQGETERQLQYIYSRSPPLTNMPFKDCYKINVPVKEWATYLVRVYIEYMFGANKLWRVKQERKDISRWLYQVCRGFELNTSIGLQPELTPYFENCSFKTAKGIITCTENFRESLIDSGLLKTARGATMVQKVSYCQISKRDIHPMDEKAPHDMVTLENGDVFRRNPDGGLLTTEVKTITDLDYIEQSGNVYIICCIRDGDFGSKDTVLRAGMKQITRYDEFVPTGFVFGQGSQKNNCQLNGPLYPAPQTTYFTDAKGTDRCLSVSMCNQWLKNIFKWFTENDNVTETLAPNHFPPLKEGWEGKIPWNDIHDLSNSFPFCYKSDRGLRLFKYVMQNYWMTKEIFLSNLLTLYWSSDADVKLETQYIFWSEKDDDVIPEDISLDGIKDETEREKIKKLNDRNKLIKESKEKALKEQEEEVAERSSSDYPQSDFMKFWANNYHAFKTEVIMAAYREVIPRGTDSVFSRNKNRAILNRLQAAYKRLINLKNEDYDKNLDLGINPGVAVMWIKPQFCESESIIVSRPAGFTNISANPVLKKQLDLKDDSDHIMFSFSQHSAHSVNGISNTSVKLPGAIMIQKLAEDVDLVVSPNYPEAKKCLDGLNHYGQDKYLLNMTRGESFSKFWPVLWKPNAPMSIMESGVSPTGRCTTQWIDAKTFEKQFFDDKSVKDCFYPNEFTVNDAFNDMRFNINTFFYPSEILSKPQCPLNKYFRFNINSSKVITDMIRNHSRKNGSVHSRACQPTESSIPVYTDDSDVARIIGVCLPKRCFTHYELKNQENQFKNPTIYQSRSIIQRKELGHHFFFPGNDALEKFDTGIPYSSFTK